MYDGARRGVGRGRGELPPPPGGRRETASTPEPPVLAAHDEALLIDGYVEHRDVAHPDVRQVAVERQRIDLGGLILVIITVGS